MWRYLAGGVAALLMVAAGLALFNGRARSDPALPPQPASAAVQASADAALPDGMPEASEKTREEKRFARYDRDKDGKIAREEYLAARRKAYAKLDTNHDGMLSFDEWAAKTTAKFAAADVDRSGAMTPAEFVSTKPKRSAKPRCVCPVAKAEEE